MQISTKKIKALNPCADRFNNYLEHYSDFKGSVADFAMLENITYEDKIWVLVRLMSHAQKVEFTVKCASSVLDVFEAKFSDDRPRKALEAAEKWLNNPCEETRLAAYAAADAAYAAADAAAAYAARAADAVRAAAAAAAAADADAAYAAAAAAAARAAADAARAAADAADAAAYAAYAADTVYAAAAWAARAAGEEELNLIFAVEILSLKY
jgi:hypothetical protein